MNLLLLEPRDLIGPDRARIAGARLRHLRQVLGSQPGSTVRAGLVGGLMGTGQVERIDEESATLALELADQPPAKLPLTLIAALPRPKAIRRLLRTAAEQGVARLILLNSWKVEKSYWQTPVLTDASIRGYLLEGLQQARDTILPKVDLEPRFKPFVEDRLPALVAGTRGLLAHPGNHPACPCALDMPCTLAIGPEGGFTEYEAARLTAAGLQPVQLGKRILRVETAAIALPARLFT